MERFTRIHITMRTFCTFLLLALLTACGAPGSTKEGAEEEGHGHEAGHEGESPEITAQQFAAIEGKLGRVEMKDLTASLKAAGFLKVPPQNIADVSSPVAGTVQRIHVEDGDIVRKGQALITIADPLIVETQRSYLEARAQLVFAKAELERQTELAASNVSAQKTLQQAKATHAGLQAQVQAGAQILRLWSIDPERLTPEDIRATMDLTSPINGAVARIDVNVGSNVGSGAPAVRVVDNSELHVDVFIYEQDIDKVKKGQRIGLSLTNVPGRSYTAEVFAIGSAFETETRTIPVHARITGDKQGLIDGMGVTAYVQTGTTAESAVPTDAIVSSGGNDYVFLHTEAEVGEEHGETGHAHTGDHDHVHDHDHGDEHDHAKEGTVHKSNEGHEHTGNMHFQRVQVKRGVTEGGYTGITFLQPVAPNAEVVVSGAFYLMAMMTNSGEHSH